MFEKQIARIQSKQERCWARYSQREMYGPYAREAQISRLESDLDLQLPLDYRAWIQTVGDGIWDESCRENDLLCAFFRENDPTYEYYGDSGSYPHLVPFPLKWTNIGDSSSSLFSTLNREVNRNSEMAHILHYAPSNEYFLLVLNGENKGRVWKCADYHDSEHSGYDNFAPTPCLGTDGQALDFLGWLEQEMS